MKQVIGFGMLVGLIIYGYLAWYVKSYTESTVPNKSQAAIVLGARSYIGTKYNECLVKRVESGIDLYNHKIVDTLIFSGGTDKEDKRNEAATMQKIALERGVRQDDILLEKTSTSTYENLLNTKKLMEDQNISSAVVVTAPYHIARAMLTAKTLGMSLQYYGAADSPCWKRGYIFTNYFLKEPLAIIYYIITGKIDLQKL
jgi:vancomycin permeability regulator SanA